MFASIRYIQILCTYAYTCMTIDGTENEPALSSTLLQSHVFSHNKLIHAVKGLFGWVMMHFPNEYFICVHLREFFFMRGAL